MILTRENMAGMSYQLSDGTLLPLERLAAFFDKVEGVLLDHRQKNIGDGLAIQLLAINYNNQILNHLSINKIGRTGGG